MVEGRDGEYSEVEPNVRPTAAAPMVEVPHSCCMEKIVS